MADDTETTIPPALTEDQWRAVARDAAHPDEPGRPITGVAIAYTDGELPTGALSNPFAPHALIALLNAALPDGDPRKITRDDLWQLDQAVEDAGAIRVKPQVTALRALHAKLAALLPPEGA